MAYVTLFSRRRTVPHHYRDKVNFKPFVKFFSFSELNTPGKVHYFIELFGNVAVFIPFIGVLSILSGKRFTFKKALAASILFTLLIEVLQFVFNRGVFDIDDIVLNTLGGVLGFFIFNFIRDRKL